MILGALVDAGVPVDALRAELGKLPLDGWTLEARQVHRGAFRATKVDVAIGEDVDHPHRSLADVLDVLERGDLSEEIRSAATRIFTRLADAEARAHGTTPDTVRFHDVGAVDAIIDVTGAVIGLTLLGADRIQNRAGIDARSNLQRNPCRQIGLNQSGYNVH